MKCANKATVVTDEMIRIMNVVSSENIRYSLRSDLGKIDIWKRAPDGQWDSFKWIEYDELISMMKLEYQCHLNAATRLMKCMIQHDIVKQNMALVLIKDVRERQWKSWECWIMNILDLRFWFCKCHYQASYGKVIMGGCEKHD